MAVDDSKLPSVMPTSVPRVTADGRPTQHMINWEEVTRNWYYTNAVATDQRITQVKAEAEGALASYKEEINAVIGPEGSLVTKVETVEARANSATASGQIYFAAKAGPSGSVAAYGIYLTAGNAFTGLEMLAQSDGTSVIGLRANDLVFTDDGTQKQVLTYSSGKFTFTGDVAINGSLVVNGTIITDKIQAKAITNFGDAEGSGNGTTPADVTAYVTTRSGDRIAVLVTIIATMDAVGSNPVGSGTVYLNGGSAQTIPAQKTLYQIDIPSSDAADIVQHYRYINATYQHFFTAPSTGTQAIRVVGFKSTDVVVTATAYSR